MNMSRIQKIPHSAFRIPHSKGVVYLVGAGPGDPQLITVKGADALKQADVVIYDHLVSTRLLAYCSPTARLIYAGKEQGRHTKPQAEIHRLLVRFANAGKRVVRLKGGDPCLFGRGGEEALALAKARVPFEIIPGVTSAIAVPAYAGIPVTHREVSSSVAIITGHEDPTKPASGIRWAQLATATDTLICLMGVGTLGETARRLIRHGRAASTPCAVIEWGTFPQQRTVTGTLSTIASRCAAAGLKPPAVVVVGAVARLRARLNWFERKPLFGRRVIVTRPTDDRTDQLAERLEALGADVVRLPAIALAPVESNGRFRQAINDIGRFDWVFFTSPEGIHWFRRMLAGARRDLRILHGCHIGAIGPKTSASIERLGIHVDFLPRAFSQDGMVHELRRRKLAGKRALILSARDSRDVLEQGLRAEGMEVLKVPLYQTVVPHDLARRVRAAFTRPVDYVTVTSSSCVEHLVSALRAARLGAAVRRLPFASIGPVTSATVRRHGGRVAVEAPSATIEALAEAIAASACRRRGRVCLSRPRGGREAQRSRGAH